MATAIASAEPLEGGGGGPVPEANRLVRRRWAPYLLLAPGLAWLIVFFVFPLFTLAGTSTQTHPEGTEIGTFVQTWTFSNYVDAVKDYHEQFIRSFVYAGIATLLCLAIGYPLAYVIAFKAGRCRNLLLVLVIAPFFTSFILRTIAWKQILGAEGRVVEILNDLHLVDGPVTGGRVRGRLRSDVQLPAVHDAAAVREPRTHRPARHRGGRRPLRPALHRASQGDVPARRCRGWWPGRC